MCRQRRAPTRKEDGTARSALLVATLFAFAGPLAAAPVLAAHKGEPEKVVYHINEGNEQAADGLRNIQNHLSVDPKVRIVVVTHAKGVDFLMEGAEDKNGNPFSIPVEQLASQGVEFRVCEITLKRRNLDRSRFLEQVKYVPSGVKEVARLQHEEGYAYLKP